GASASRRDRCRHGVCRDISHMVHRDRNRRTTYGKCSSARFASSDRPDCGHCSARDYELVFHKIYWGGWIRAHTSRRKALFGNSNGEGSYLRCGLILLGFTSLYREGFEVVLFLQSYNLRLGGSVVLKGALLGLLLSGMVAVLTFLLQQHLPYRKMLITTGILLGVVLEVMVGEQAQEMQLAHWISRTDIGWLTNVIPAWMGMWFAVFPTYETMVAQLSATILVVGSYYAATHMQRRTRPDNSYSASATAASSSLSQVVLNNQSLVLSLRQSVPSLQTGGCIAAGEGQRQLLQNRQRLPQFGWVFRQ